MPSQVFNRHYWSARELVVLGVFSAAAKLSTLLVALVGGGMNPVSLLAKNLIFTTLLVVMLYKVRKPGTLALFVLVNMLISMLLLGGSVTLLPAMLLAAGCGEAENNPTDQQQQQDPIMKTYGDDFFLAQAKAMGYTDEMIEAVYKKIEA